MQENVSFIVVRYRQNFPSLGSRFGITRQNLVMPNRDPRVGNFCLYLTAMKDTYIQLPRICSPAKFKFKIESMLIFMSPLPFRVRRYIVFARVVCLSVCLSVCPSVCLSVRLSVTKSCPLCNLKTVQDIFMKLHITINQHWTKCRVQEP